MVHSKNRIFELYPFVITISAFALFWEFEGSFAGLLLYYIFQIESDLGYFISLISNTECLMISFERCESLCKIPPETGYKTNEIIKKILEIKKKKVLSEEIIEKKVLSEEIIEFSLENWPNEGKIEFRHISIKYRANLDFVLKNLSFTLKANEKNGIVCRTGAGKSTMILSLLRILEAFTG